MHSTGDRAKTGRKSAIVRGGLRNCRGVRGCAATRLPFEVVGYDVERIIEAKIDETYIARKLRGKMKIKLYPRSIDLCIREDNQLMADAIITREYVPFERAWQMTFIEVCERHQRKGVATKLYERAKEIAAEQGCRLLPHPDLLRDGFAFWMAMDRDALLEVLSHERSREIVEESGGDVEQFAQQLELLRSE